MKRFLNKFDLLLGSAVMVIMVAIVVVQVIFRYFGNPLSWPEEIARWTMIWITFAGASYCFKNGGLIRVEYFVQKFFSKPVQNLINIVNMAIMAGFFVFLGYSSLQYMLLTIRKHQVYNVTRVPYSVISFALVLGSVLCLLFSASQIIQLIADRKKLQEDEGREAGEGTK